MAAPEPQKSPEETIAIITEVKQTRGDKFLVKVFKRKNAAGLFEWFADLADASAFQIASPEPWIHQLGGGGEYRIQAYHMDATTVPVGGRLPVMIPGQGYQYPVIGADALQSWVGPRTIVALASATPQQQAGASVFAQAPQQMQQGYGTPAQAQGNGAVVQPFPQYPPGHPYAQAYLQPQSQTDQFRTQLEQKERELAARELRIERERAEREAEVKRSESEQRLRAESDAKIRELNLKIEANTAAAQAAAAALAARPAADPGAWVKDLVAALAPIGLQMMTASQQARDMQFKMQLDAQERADRRAAEDRAENRKVLEALATKPGMTDETKILIETLRSQGAVAADFARQTMDATSVVTKNSLAMIETISAIKFGDEPESPVLLAIREGVSALKHLGVGGANAARRATQQQQPQLPYSTAATAPVPPAMPPIVPTNGQTPPAQVQRFDGIQTGGAAAQVAGPGQIQAPAPAGAPAGTPPLSLHEAQQLLRRSQPPTQFEDPLQVLELGIKAHHNPIEIATYFFASVTHPKMHAALKEVGGEVDDLLAARLGMPWINDPQNTPYILQLGGVLEDMGIKLGVYSPPPDGDDDDDQDGPEDDQIPPAAQTIDGN